MDTIENMDRRIIAYSKELKLPVFRRDYKQMAQEAAKDHQDHETFLMHLMEKQWEERLENRKRSQVRQAGFPSKMYLVDLQRDLLPIDAKDKLPGLERLDFVTNGQNIVLAGNPGTGKTHIAIGLGLKACMQGYKVLFTTVHKLLTQIRDRTLSACCDN